MLSLDSKNKLSYHVKATRSLDGQYQIFSLDSLEYNHDKSWDTRT
jgi:hypothetical protein